MPKKEAAIKKATAAHAAAVSKTPSETDQKKATKKSLLSQTVSSVVSAVESTRADYIKSLTPRSKLIDQFLVFLVLLGVLQFVYVLLIGNFPFNAFLGGFISCVGQFVLTVSLRLQYGSQKATAVSPERALGEYIFASLILHFIVFHFIN